MIPQTGEEIEQEKPSLYQLPARRSSFSDSSSDESRKKPGRQKRNLMKFDPISTRNFTKIIAEMVASIMDEQDSGLWFKFTLRISAT